MKDIKEGLVNESRLLVNQVLKLQKLVDELKLKQYKIITKYKTLTNEK